MMIWSLPGHIQATARRLFLSHPRSSKWRHPNLSRLPTPGSPGLAVWWGLRLAQRHRHRSSRCLLLRNHLSLLGRFLWKRLLKRGGLHLGRPVRRGLRRAQYCRDRSSRCLLRNHLPLLGRFRGKRLMPLLQMMCRRRIGSADLMGVCPRFGVPRRSRGAYGRQGT